LAYAMFKYLKWAGNCIDHSGTLAKNSKPNFLYL